MQAMTRLVAPLFAAALLAACASTPTDEDNRVPDNTMTPDTSRVDSGTTTEGLVDPRDNTDPRGLTDPESLLSKRVVYFDYDSSRVRPEFMEIIRAHATFMGANPGYGAKLEGHADERGTREYNLGLGERRARSVMDMLVARGGSRGQMDTVSYGEERPVRGCSSESCWSQNRRVEIVYAN